MHTKLPGKSLNPKHFFGKKREDVQTNKKKMLQFLEKKKFETLNIFFLLHTHSQDRQTSRQADRQTNMKKQNAHFWKLKMDSSEKKRTFFRFRIRSNVCFFYVVMPFFSI